MAIPQCKSCLRTVKYVQDRWDVVQYCAFLVFWCPIPDSLLFARRTTWHRRAIHGFFDTKNPKSGRAEWQETVTEPFRSVIYKHGGVRNAKTKCVFTTSCDLYLGSSIHKYQLKTNKSGIPELLFQPSASRCEKKRERERERFWTRKGKHTESKKGREKEWVGSSWWRAAREKKGNERETKGKREKERRRWGERKGGQIELDRGTDWAKEREVEKTSSARDQESKAREREKEK